MVDKKKLKKTRAVIRTAVTKIMNQLKNKLDSQSVDTLHEHFDHLNENLKELRELDNKIQNIIPVEEKFDANNKQLLLNDTSWLQGPEWLRLLPEFWPESKNEDRPSSPDLEYRKSNDIVQHECVIEERKVYLTSPNIAT
ncbi:hypothetical protein TNIN_319881 [Trichonephila inaurata madagascariensis]|uniref:Uncharacterized protein n=1 Tax=Trichonephila inaurata madagascariensis TaxID=2747483 RepID=A0A8X7C7W1_9ARAC|nr:hypothetical protein TNIN_319881 [Trichonephila inaurata madagascariensis]